MIFDGEVVNFEGEVRVIGMWWEVGGECLDWLLYSEILLLFVDWWIEFVEIGVDGWEVNVVWFELDWSVLLMNEVFDLMGFLMLWEKFFVLNLFLDE